MSESRDRDASYDVDGRRMYRCAVRLSRTRRCRRYTPDTYHGVQVCAEHAEALLDALRERFAAEVAA